MGARLDAQRRAALLSANDPGQRARFRALAGAHGAAFRILSCRADAEVLRRRVRERAVAGGDASQATPAVLEAQLARLTPLGDAERAEVLDVDTTGPVDAGALAARLRRAGH